MKKKILFFIFLFSAPFIFCQTEQDLSVLLGGIIKSDKWIIRKDAFEEEFIGNVRYENDTYKLSADRALSKRKAKTYELTGDVFLSRTEEGKTLTLTAGRVFYDQNKDFGFAQKSKNAQVEIIYKTPENTYTLTADKIEFSKQVSFFEASGKVKLTDKANTLKAKRAVFDRISGIFEATEARPIVTGKNEDGSYAFEADKIEVNINTRQVRAFGKANGWITLEKDLFTEENLKKLKD